MRYLGIDYGLRKIGLSIGDDETRIASPLEVIGPENLFNDILTIIKEENIEAVVVGVPKKVGTFHSDEQKNITQAFIEDLRKKIGFDISEIDESFTSRESQRLQKEYGATAKEDALAAMLILQAFFNELV